MKINTTSWKDFRFGDLINSIGKSKAINKGDLMEAEGLTPGIRYITRTAEDNGCEMIADVSLVEKRYIQKGNAITVGDTTATCFYQSEDFITGEHMVVIRADWLNEKTGLFITSLLNQEQYKYSYGRAFKIDNIQETILKLPTTSDNEPDWQFMENYIASLHHKLLTTNNRKNKADVLDTSKWKEFKVKDLFDLKSTKGIVTDDLIEGKDVPYMAAKHESNGIAMMCSSEGFEDWISEGNCIVFINLGAGSAGYVNYIKEDFIGMSGKTTCGYNDNLNEYNGLFIATCLCLERPKYSYGRSWTGDRLKDTIVKLPATSAGEPDWQFMEDYIKSLPYGDRI